MKRSRCPIPSTHRRLEQAHRLWHQALETYDDAEGFHANLNALIESLRNVTFMLQSEKERIAGFDDWYKKWQEAMKGDIVMSWLHDARTTVVHKGDLETASTAVARVHTNLTLATATINVPPTIPTDVASTILANKLPEPFASNPQDLVLSVERRWCVADLPGYELLDALAHAYAVLSKLVMEAHERMDHELEDLVYDANHPDVLGDRRPCMIATTELRTVRISLADRKVLAPHKIAVSPSPREIAIAAHRYGIRESLPLADDPFQFAETLIPLAKKILKKDKHHTRLVWLKSASGWTCRELNAFDRTEKYVLMRHLAEEIQRLKVTALVDIGEVRMLSKQEELGGPMPNDAPGRKEALFIWVATSDGRFRSYLTPFSRNIFGKVKLENTTVADSDFPTYMAPVCEVWGLPIPAPAEDPD